MNKYAMIFAAGMGTRLGALSETTPKALIEISGKPVIEHILNRLIRFGFTHIIVNVCHHAKKITDFLDNFNTDKCKILISHEQVFPLDTGGGLKYAMHLFTETEQILLHNVDIVSNINLAELYAYHYSKDTYATLAVKQRSSSRYFLFDENYLLKGWENTAKNEKIIFSNDSLTAYAFSGIHVVSRKIFELFPAQEVFSIIKFYLDICNLYPVSAYLHNYDAWIDIGKPEHFAKADKIITMENY